MSLSSFMHDQPVRERFYAEFTKPKVLGHPESTCKSLTTHYKLVGTGFDYLARLYLQRMYPRAKHQKTVAEMTAARLNKPSAWDDELTPWTGPVFGMAFDIVQELFGFPLSPSLQDDDSEDGPCPYPFLRHREALVTRTVAAAYSDVVLEIVSEAKETRNRYIAGERVPIKDLADQCLKLAQIDALYRTSRPDPWLGETDPKDVEDLVALFHLFEKQKWLKGKKLVFLNPTFGEASDLVGGADADLVLDDLLVDIKCSKDRNFFGGVFHQLLGYYILSRIGGIGKPPRPHVIKQIGVYYARHGELLTFPVQSFVPEDKLPNVKKWFKQLAKQHLKRRPVALLSDV
jgi:hypothetical protein